MPTLILAGLPQAVYLRHKSFTPSVAGWEVKLCNSRDSRANINTCIAQLHKIADEASTDGAHIFAFHAREDERGKLAKQFYGRHRLCWLDSSLLTEYGTVGFNEKLIELADFEYQWRQHIKPTDVKAALILPELSFTAARQVRDLWLRAQHVTTVKDQIRAVESLSDRFKAHHWKSKHWCDDDGLEFRLDGPPHGQHVPVERSWKYTFKVPVGFHFDVKHTRGGPFSICDHNGDTKNFRSYTNVDCHGILRAGV